MSAVATRPRLVVRHRPEPALDETFRALGTDVRMIAEGTGARTAVARARAEILDYHARLSRFLPSSELTRLNADARPVVPASALLRCAVEAGLWAARASGGLVDPCLLGALEAAGYDRSFEPGRGIDTPGPRHRPTFGSQEDPTAGRSAQLGRVPGAPCPAAPAPAARWRTIRVDDQAGTITRPPGLRLDLGGSGKGHVADLVARHFADLAAWVVDCGGDIRVGGTRQVEVAHPLRDRDPAGRATIRDGAVATSSIVSRAWTGRDGRRAHHLLDPSTGEPAHSGLLSATALAPTTLHAETLAKVALLSGPPGARRALALHGGLVVHDDGDVETIGARR